MFVVSYADTFTLNFSFRFLVVSALLLLILSFEKKQDLEESNSFREFRFTDLEETFYAGFSGLTKEDIASLSKLR